MPHSGSRRMSGEKAHTYGALRNGIRITTRCHPVRYVYVFSSS